jgi:hypothetical protein
MPKAFNLGACALRRMDGTDQSLAPLFRRRRDILRPVNRGCNPARDRNLAPSAGQYFFSSPRCRDKALALRLLASELVGSADRFSPFARHFLGRLLVKSSALHFAKNALALHLLLQYAKGLIDIVVANKYLQETFLSCCSGGELTRQKTQPTCRSWAKIERHSPRLACRRT